MNNFFFIIQSVKCFNSVNFLSVSNLEVLYWNMLLYTCYYVSQYFIIISISWVPCTLKTEARFHTFFTILIFSVIHALYGLFEYIVKSRILRIVSVRSNSLWSMSSVWSFKWHGEYRKVIWNWILYLKKRVRLSLTPTHLTI